MRYIPRRPWLRAALVFPLIVAVIALLWWRGPEWGRVASAFDVVDWVWIVFALGLNLASVLLRSLAWRLTIDQALDPPHPRFDRVFSAFSVGLLGNAVLPGRIGELARVAVLRRHLPHGSGTTGVLVGTVFAHRLFDLFPALLLVVYVITTAKIPHWAVTSLVIVSVIGILLFTVAVASARRGRRPSLDGANPLRRLLVMARQGLAVLRSPLPAAGAIVLQCGGWLLQLLAVYVAMRAFNIHAPLPAAGLVLLLMNVATIFPLWPGNFGLLQAAVAFPLVQYGVAYSTGFAYALVLQVVEMSVGVGVGLIFLAREGLSFAMLRGHARRARPSGGRRTRRTRSRGRRRHVRALACPASLKGVLTAPAAAAALAEGLREGGADVDELPVADGGEGTSEALWLALGGDWHESDVHDAFGRPRRARWLRLPDGTAVVEAAAAIPLDPLRLDPLEASSRGFGELVRDVLEHEPASLLLALGGTATMDAGAGFLEVVRELPVPARVACDVTATLAEAPRVFGPQKGAGPEEIAELERRFAAEKRLVLFNTSSAVALRAGSARRSRQSVRSLCRARRSCSTPIGFDPSGYDLVVTGEGRVDATTMLGKAPGEVAGAAAAGTRCVVFGGLVEAELPGVETVALSGDPARARGRPRRAGTRLSVEATARKSGARRPRAACARVPGRASTRSGSRSRRSDGTPRTSSRTSSCRYRR